MMLGQTCLLIILNTQNMTRSKGLLYRRAADGTFVLNQLRIIDSASYEAARFEQL